MYLVGKFERSTWDDKNPLYDVKIVNEIDKTHLGKTVKDSDYQVIDIIKRQYFDPKSNSWIKIKEAK